MLGNRPLCSAPLESTRRNPLGGDDGGGGGGGTGGGSEEGHGHRREWRVSHRLERLKSRATLVAWPIRGSCAGVLEDVRSRATLRLGRLPLPRPRFIERPISTGLTQVAFLAVHWDDDGEAADLEDIMHAVLAL